MISIWCPFGLIRNRYTDLHEVLAYRGTYWSFIFLFSVGTCLDVLACFGLFVSLWFCFVRAVNRFWSLLLRLATQVLAPGAGDVASA